MCNANNHRPGCNCGWGGGNHNGGYSSGRRRSSNYQTINLHNRYYFEGIPRISDSYESFTTPNATCPVCGSTVFFYQSPYGGRVFFDSLGPPWPKHACTDNKHTPRKITTSTSIKSISYSWQKNNWRPFIVNHTSKVDSKSIHIKGRLGVDSFSLYIENNGDNYTIKEGCILQLKDHDDYYDLSIILTSLKIVTIQAFLFRMDLDKHLESKLISEEESPRKGYVVKTGSKNTDRKNKKNPKAKHSKIKKTHNKEAKQPKNRIINPIMAVAFKKAQEDGG